ncbi:lysine transporter LysE [Arthrobacter sp. MYb229]|uniref:LysE family translocator n=1 Tax=unclassified Arthrobacter TaxID=235627 RepID=UPI000CFDE8FA|nr:MULTISPECIES: LysE family translocator [unclassified Arthrobacter]PRA06496.1 lysine transporter LysE [Arthrobacter sp. MYb229]PRB53398.1 lysine transporter LysE [Arthrobacter sp. MYb216]
MDIAQLTGFLLVSITLACTPGADWAYIISSAIGPKGYCAAVWGLLTGYLFHTALLVCGVAALVASSPQLLLWLTMAGSLYLLWLGVVTLASWRSAKFYGTSSPASSESMTPVNSSSDPAELPFAATAVLTKTRPLLKPGGPWRGAFFKGLLTSGTNPKALLLYLALIPQFIDRSATWPLSLQTGALGLTHFAVSVLVYFSIAFASRLLLRSRPLAARIVTASSGIIMIGLSLVLIYEQFLGF